MALRLYDSKSRTIRDFEPVTPGRVGIYVCGPTVHSSPHVVTDIDDKILHNAGHENVEWWALGERNTRAFTAAYDALNVLPPTGEPRATGHVPEMVVLMQRLIDAGHAYAAGGDVYFDVRSFSSYGSLSGQQPDQMRGSEDVGAKRDPLDFALWKGAKSGEPFWPTPWGPGRPGWHLECSAMATKYLGTDFDIHGGGLDLVFPHHENELAQSRAAGDGFARWWMHNGMVNTSGEKMSKSLGNSLVVADVLQRARPAAVRYLLGSAHYRSDIDWTEDALTEADVALGRIENFLDRAGELIGGPDVTLTALPAEFAEAMNDDIAVPRALGVVHETVRAGNAALASGEKESMQASYDAVLAMMTVLGLSPADFVRGTDANSALSAAVQALVPAMLAARQAARDRKDFAEADRIRDALAAAGLVIEDTATGPRWRLGGQG